MVSIHLAGFLVLWMYLLRTLSRPRDRREIGFVHGFKNIGWAEIRQVKADLIHFGVIHNAHQKAE